MSYIRSIPPTELVTYDPEVSVTAIGDLNAPVLVLGLLHQQEDTIAGLDLRLQRQFAAAGFSRGSANKSIPGLAERGLIKLVERGDKSTLARYRITPVGTEYFLSWLRQTELSPTVRDVLQCKFAFFQLDEIPGIIEALEDQAITFDAAVDLANDTLQAEQRVRRNRKRRGNPPSLPEALSIAKTKDAVNIAQKMRDRLNEAVDELRDIHEEFRAIEDVDE
jgi:DNA-binding PadR family transcriptional regulator